MSSQPRSTDAASAPTRLPRWIYPVTTVVALLLGITTVVRGTRAVVRIEDSDLTNFFFKSAQYILRGDPWHIYAARGSGVTATYPNYNPPLSTFLYAPLLELARLLKFDATYGEQITFVALPFVVLVPLLGYLALRVLRRMHPDMPETQRYLAYVLIVLSPLTWQSYAPWYHLEQPLMLCFLVAAILATQARHEEIGGLLAGLAILSRTTALMPLIAVGLVLLLNRRWLGAVKLALGTGVVTAVGFAPFFLAYPRETIYSLVQWRGGAQIGGNTFWTVFLYAGDTGIRHTINAVAERLDMYVVVLFILVVTVLAVRRFRVTPEGKDLWALAGLAALAIPMLAKNIWPYYYLEPFVLLMVWEVGTLHDRRSGVWRWPLLSIGFLSVAATLSQYVWLQSVGAADRIAVGLLETALMAGFALAVWSRLKARKPESSAAGVAYAAPGMAGAWGAPYGGAAHAPKDRNQPARPAVMPEPKSIPFGQPSAAPYAPDVPGAPQVPNPPSVPWISPQPAPPASSNPLWPADQHGAPPATMRGHASPPGNARDEQWPDLWPDGAQGQGEGQHWERRRS